MYNIVKNITKKYKTSDPFELASCMDINIIYKDLGTGIRGLYQYYNRGQAIYLNSELSYDERKKVLCHELGHAVLHRKMNRIFLESKMLTVPNRYENEANLFAAYITISDDDIEEYFTNGYTYYQIADMTGFDVDIIKKRIMN